MTNKLPQLKLVLEESVDYRTVKSITNSQVAHEYGLSIWEEDNLEMFEEFKVVFLNNKNKPIGWMKAGEGTLTQTIVDTKRIFAMALLSRCSSMMLYHNHPSGDSTPSSSDIMLTKKIVNAGELLDINVLDHIIITKYGYRSLKEEGDF